MFEDSDTSQMGRDISVLIIEDNVLERAALEMLFSAMGASQVASFGTIMQAVQHLYEKVNEIDLIVSDIMLDQHDGVDLLNFIAEKRVSTPVVIVSSLEDEILRTTMLNAQAKGVNVLGYVRKPVTEAVIEAILSLPGSVSARGGKERVVNKMSVEEIYNAINYHMFTPYFLPIARVADNQIVGAHVMSRCVRTSGEVVSPESYVPTMASNKMLMELHDELVYDSALTKVGELSDAGQQTMVTLTLTSDSLIEVKEPVEKLLRKVNFRNIKPENVVLELSTGERLYDRAVLAENVARLRMAGFKVVIGNYGGNNPDIQYLNQLPISGIKIDSSLLRNISSDKKTRCLLRSSIQLAKDMDITCTADGVRNEQDLEFLQDSGCDYAQGSLFGDSASLGEIPMSWFESHDERTREGMAAEDGQPPSPE